MKTHHPTLTLARRMLENERGADFFDVPTVFFELRFLMYNKMPATLALRVMLGLIHLFQLYASPIDKSILANGIV